MPCGFRWPRVYQRCPEAFPGYAVPSVWMRSTLPPNPAASCGTVPTSAFPVVTKSAGGSLPVGNRDDSRYGAAAVRNAARPTTSRSTPSTPDSPGSVEPPDCPSSSSSTRRRSALVAKHGSSAIPMSPPLPSLRTVLALLERADVAEQRFCSVSLSAQEDVAAVVLGVDGGPVGKELQVPRPARPRDPVRSRHGLTSRASPGWDRLAARARRCRGRRWCWGRRRWAAGGHNGEGDGDDREPAVRASPGPPFRAERETEVRIPGPFVSAARL